MRPTVLRLDNFRQERNMLDSRKATEAGHADRGDRRRPGRAVLRRARPAAADRLGAERTRSPSGSATPPTTRSASAWCSPTRPWAASSTPTRRCYAAMEREFARWDDIDVHFKGEVVTSGGHGFAAMSRKRLLQILQDRCARARRGRPVLDRRARRRRALAATTTSSSPATGSTPPCARGTPTRSGRPSTSRDCKYMWLGTDKVFDAFKFYIAQTPYGVMQIHGYPFDAHGQHVHRRDERRGVGAAGFAALRRPAVGARRVRRGVDRAGPRAVRRRPRRTRGARPTTPAGSASPRSATSTGVTTTWCCSATPRTPRTSRSAPAPSSPWRTRSRWPPACTRSRRVDAALEAYETERKAGGALHAARGAGQPGVVREPRPVRRPGAAAVRVQHHDPQPAGHLRQPAGARPGVRGAGSTRWFAEHEQRRGHGDRRRTPADVPAVPRAAAGLELVNRVVVSPMDMYVADGRHARRLPPRAPRRQGARRRRPGDDRDGLRLPRGPDHPWLHGAVERRAARRLAPGHRLRAPRLGREDRPAARPLRRARARPS